MFRFRVVSIIESPSLGDMLGTLQSAGCEVLQCNVITDTGDVEQVVMPPQAKPHALPAPEPRVKRGHRGSRSAGMGATEYARLVFADFKPGDTVKRLEVVKRLEAAGYHPQAARSAFAYAVNSNRYKKISHGTYIVRVPSAKPKKPAPALNQPSALTFLKEYVAKLPRVTEVTRTTLLNAGVEAGFTVANLNTSIQEVYKKGLLIRLGGGVYQTPTAPSVVAFTPDHRTDVIRHVEEEQS